MSFLDLIYPKKCVGCGKQGSYFCDTCTQTISLAPEDSFLYQAVSLFNYRGLMRLGIHKLKYRFLTDSQSDWYRLVRLALGQKLSSRFGWRLKRFLLTNPIVVPVPLYWRRHNWRGFNQAELIANWVAQALSLTVNSKLVVRVKATKPQVGLKKHERHANINQAFVLKGLAPMTALVVDDVWTSGATVKAVVRALKRGGAKEVWALTLAR